MTDSSRSEATTGQSPEPAQLVSLAVDLVSQIAPRLVESRTAQADGTASIGVSTKSTANDLVTEMDEWTEKTLVEGLLRARPNDGVLGEEGSSIAGTNGVRWVIDPIDGTTNYFYDLSGYSISVAAQIDGVTVGAVVADPVRDEVFTATLGGGAFRNGQPITASSKDDLATALIATGFNYDHAVRLRQATSLASILPKVRDIRRVGGAAVDICLVACGRADAHYEEGLSIWDVAAAALIATEAGAAHTEFGGQPDKPGLTVISSPGIHDDLIALLHEAGAIIVDN